MQVMTSMEYDDEEMADNQFPMEMPDKPKYPCGLRICLTEKEMAKLNLDPSEAFVGGIIHIFALARITSVSQNETEGGECSRIEAQIESMAIESEDEENEEMDAAEDVRPSMRDRAKALYDRS